MFAIKMSPCVFPYTQCWVQLITLNFYVIALKLVHKFTQKKFSKIYLKLFDSSAYKGIYADEPEKIFYKRRYF